MEGWDLRALAVLERLNAAGHRAVLVGGCVRDRLLGLAPHDYDAATSARPEQIREACAPMRVVETGVRHGTVTVLSGGLPIEVTTFRREGGYSDHRRPDRVEFTGDLGEDLARRDFTINAMAWEPSGLTDPFGGRADLAAGVIRCVGEPERRFGEDALRLLRALRFAAQLDFRLEEGTAAGVRACAPQLACVSRERVAEELKRLVCGPAAGRVLLDCPEVLTRQVLPELAPAVGFDQRNPHHSYDVYTHCVRALERVPAEPGLRLAALLHDGEAGVLYRGPGGGGPLLRTRRRRGGAGGRLPAPPAAGQCPAGAGGHPDPAPRPPAGAGAPAGEAVAGAAGAGALLPVDRPGQSGRRGQISGPGSGGSPLGAGGGIGKTDPGREALPHPAGPGGGRKRRPGPGPAGGPRWAGRWPPCWKR